MLQWPMSLIHLSLYSRLLESVPVPPLVSVNPLDHVPMNPVGSLMLNLLTLSGTHLECYSISIARAVWINDLKRACL